MAEELIQVSRLMDGISRARFENDHAALAQWQSASNVIGPPRSTSGTADGQNGGTSTAPSHPQGGQAKPAA